MFGRKAKGKRRSPLSWRWLRALLAGLAALLIAVWRAMIKRARQEGEERQPAAPKPATEEEENTQKKASPVVSEMTSSEADTAPPSG